MSREDLSKEKVSSDLEDGEDEIHPTGNGSLLIEDLGAGAAKKQSGILGKLWTLAKAVDKYGVEVRGIERVLEREKMPTTRNVYLNNLLFWWSSNCTIISVALGMLGPSSFELSGKISILVILMFNLLGNLPTAIFSTFGPKLGLRQMTITRFSFGYHVTWLPVVLNIISCIGSATVNSIVGAQALRAVSTTHQIPTAAAIVVIAVITFIAPFFGYKVVHTYERYAWIPVTIIFLIILGLSAKFMNLGSITSSGDQTASILSYGAACYGFALGWGTYGADYTVQMSKEVHSWKIFVMTYAGLNSGLILLECLGAALATITLEGWQEVIAGGDVGGVISIALKPTGGFAKFCLVLMALSIVAVDVPIMYSLALTFQVLGKWAQAIPQASMISQRIFLVTLGTIAYIILAIVGAGHFNAWLYTLLVVLGYWISIYAVVLLEEHVIFRNCRWDNYNVQDYKDASRLPLGVAALVALCFGVLGAVLGMANNWYIGVLGKMLGDPTSGGDIGFELSLAFTSVTYPPLRALERRWESHERQGKMTR